MANGIPHKQAYVTLLSKSSYLPGLLVLHHSLKRVKSTRPLIVMTTSTLPSEALHVIKEDGLETVPVEYLEPENKVEFDAHDARFAETWTKLAVYGLEGYERVVLMDCDMLVMRNMDDLFEMDLPADHIAASHACTCNPRKLAHYPKDWIPENCAHTYANKTQPITLKEGDRPTFHKLNSGLVMLHPSADVFTRIGETLNNDPAVQTFSFPDQDFMAYFFRGRFKPLGYQYNALKPLRGCHKPMWRDEDVCNTRGGAYCVEPWQDRHDCRNEDEVVLHGWWWDAWDEMLPRWKGNAAFEATVLPNVKQ